MKFEPAFRGRMSSVTLCKIMVSDIFIALAEEVHVKSLPGRCRVCLIVCERLMSNNISLRRHVESSCK